MATGFPYRRARRASRSIRDRDCLAYPGRPQRRALLNERKRLEAQRHLKSLARRLSGKTATVHYFHQFDDPYSELAASQLNRLRNHYSIDIECHAVPPPDRSAAPEAEALRDWSRRDATNLAKRLCIAPLGDGAAPSRLGADADALERGRALRARKGHYLGAMCWAQRLKRVFGIEILITCRNHPRRARAGSCRNRVRGKGQRIQSQRRSPVRSTAANPEPPPVLGGESSCSPLRQAPPGKWFESTIRSTSSVPCSRPRW